MPERSIASTLAAPHGPSLRIPLEFPTRCSGAAAEEFVSADSLDGALYVYDYDESAARISNRRLFSTPFPRGVETHVAGNRMRRQDITTSRGRKRARR